MLVDDYEAEFNAVFGDFEDKKLPRDDLYFQIKSEQDQSKKKKDFVKKIEGNDKILPKLGVTVKQQTEAIEHQEDFKKALEEEAKNEKKGEKPVDANLVEQLETEKQAFEGDFDKVDDEIKVQLKALY